MTTNKDFSVKFFTEPEGWIIRKLINNLACISSNSKIVELSRLSKFRKYSKTDINYYGTYTWFKPYLRKTARFHISLLTHLRETNVSAINQWNFAIENSHLLVAISEFAKLQAIEFGAKPEKIVTIPYGIDHDIFYPKVNVLVVGKPSQRKGMVFLNEIATNSSLSKDIHFVANLEGWGVNTFEFMNNVDYLEKLKFLYDWCDVLFVPSILEGGHTPTIEAMATGKPVIASKTGWNFQEAKTTTFEVNNVHEAINKLNYFADKIMIEKTLWNKQTEAFSWDNWRNAHIDAINRMLSYV